MSKLDLFIWGWCAGIWTNIAISFIHYRWGSRFICKQCGKKYRMNKSDCKYQTLYCSQDCHRLNTIDYLVERGISIEDAANYASGEEL